MGRRMSVNYSRWIDRVISGDFDGYVFAAVFGLLMGAVFAAGILLDGGW